MFRVEEQMAHDVIKRMQLNCDAWHASILILFASKSKYALTIHLVGLGFSLQTNELTALSKPHK